MRREFFSSSPADTLEIARTLGGVLSRGDVVALVGDLGAGKTVFCKGVGEALGVRPDRIVSPSFTVVTEHAGRLTLRHIDVYRLASEREARDIGLDELLGEDAVCVVEWADRIESLLPKECIKVRLTILKGDARRISMTAGDAPRFEAFVSRCERFHSGGEA